jgi:GTP-binding protein
VGRRALARISRTPGKTRACNVYAVDERYYLLDLPGYGYARASHAERSAFRRLLAGVLGVRPRLAGALWLLDIRHAPSDDDLAMQRLLGDRGTPVLAVVTKADKLARGRRPEYVRSIMERTNLAEDQCLVTSVATREGIADLRASIRHLLAPEAA